MKKPKLFSGKKYEIPKVHDAGFDERQTGDLLRGLEIPERTQKPPSPELIARLNEIAARPPFSYLYKCKDNHIR
jgi:hypothetical protein